MLALLVHALFDRIVLQMIIGRVLHECSSMVIDGQVLSNGTGSLMQFPCFGDYNSIVQWVKDTGTLLTLTLLTLLIFTLHTLITLTLLTLLTISYSVRTTHSSMLMLTVLTLLTLLTISYSVCTVFALLTLITLLTLACCSLACCSLSRCSDWVSAQAILHLQTKQPKKP